MLFENTRSAIESCKSAIRNYVESIEDIKVFSTEKYISISNKIIEIEPKLEKIKTFYNLDIRKDIISVNDLYNAIDYIIDRNYNNLDLSKLFEDFVYARKENEKSSQAEINQEITDSKESTTNSQEFTEADISKAKDDFIKDAKSSLAAMFDCDENDIVFDNDMNNKVDNFMRILAKVSPDKEEIAEKLIKEILINSIGDSLLNISNKLSSLENEEQEIDNQNTPLIVDGNDFDVINKLDVPMLPHQFTSKEQCKKYIDTKTSIYKELNKDGRYNDISDFKRSEIEKLNLPAAIKIDGNLDNLINKLSSYGSNNQNTIAQLKAICTDYLPKIENIIFLS